MNEQATLPNHLGIILDGNRRWAKKQGKNRLEGHLEGYKNFKDITKYAFDLGIMYVSAYIFSTENWERSKEEVDFLMKLALRVVTKDLDELNRNNIKIIWLGSREKISEKLKKALLDAEEKTKNNTHGILCLCFNYGGHQEIADAIKELVKAKKSTDLINEKTLQEYLYKPSVPPLDLIIRTSGERRLSGFMLYRSAYAELYFTDKLWPDFSQQDLDDALTDYSYRQRRFGK